ncbi:MAG: hypothetical protein KC620_06000 [Myxococcales bacterium]|nr:hypothetical protein [Myxococcales bacterium]
MKPTCSFKMMLGLALALALGLAACGEDDVADEATPEGPMPDEAVTWHGQIAPLIEAHCNGCHGETQTVAPFAFTDYDAVMDTLPLIRTALMARSMPPWGAVSGVPFVGDISLDEDEIAMIEAWAEAGAPKGDPMAPGTPIDITGLPFGGSDVQFQLDTPYAGQPGVRDEYRCFLYEWPGDEVTYVTGMAVAPDNAGAVHHVLTFLVPPAGAEAFDGYEAEDDIPGYKCFGQPYPSTLGPTPAIELPPSAVVAAWAPGMSDQGMRPGVGIRAEPGSRVVVQMHYYGLSDSGVPDRTAISFDTEPVVDRPACVVPLIDLNWYFTPTSLVLPAGEAVIEKQYTMNPATSFGPSVCDDVDWQGPLLLQTVMPHMHKLGRRLELTLERADGTTEQIIDAARYDFDWQRNYTLSEPLLINPGDNFTVRCVWDNSETHRRAAGLEPTPFDVNWGDGTEAEMCLVMVQLSRP